MITITATELFTGVLPATGIRTTLDVATDIPADAPALVVGVCSAEDGLEIPVPAASVLSDSTARWLLDALAAVDFKGAEGTQARVAAPEETGVSSILAVGLGDAEELGPETVRRAAGQAARTLGSAESYATTLTSLDVAAAVEGTILGAYSFPGLRTGDAPVSQRITVLSDAPEQQVRGAEATALAVSFCRDLLNTPANLLTPKVYAEVLSTVAERLGVGCEVLEEDQLKAQGFGGIIAVGQGSANPPRLVRLTWAPEGAAEPTVGMVGKGITFDTGGISLKPGSHMEDMISDMGGSAAVAASVFAAALRGLKVSVTATLPLAENMPSGTATRPGDVIKHYGGITSEVINTDAEGRLVLSDALARASEDNPTFLLETATLTGAQIVALGDRTSGVMGTDSLRNQIAELGREVGEQAWAMPLVEEHEETIKSPIADIRNSSNSRSGGMLYAGTYLSRFVGEGIAWAHVDIAGPSWNDGAPWGYTPKRATGVPVRTFVEFLNRVAEGEITA